MGTKTAKTFRLNNESVKALNELTELTGKSQAEVIQDALQKAYGDQDQDQRDLMIVYNQAGETIEGKYLITTDDWFYAPDGKKYRAVYGEVTVEDDSILKVKTNRNSSNWFLKVGTDENHVVVAGCQIHYAVKCVDRPHDGKVSEINYSSEGITNVARETEIYFCA